MDYASLLRDALALVAEFGRDVTLRRLAATTAMDQPWRAGETSVPSILPLKAVAVGPNKSFTPEFLEDLEDVFLVAGDTDFSTWHELVDGSVTWKIVRVQAIKPGPVGLVHYVGVKR